MSLEIVLRRVQLDDNVTIGELSVNGTFECFTCEDVVRYPGVKVPKQTAIPYGRYEIFVTRSNRFGVDLPLLANVPMFEGIRIHPGNTAADTEGCILPGKTKLAKGVGESKLAFASLFKKINDARSRMNQVFITIEAKE